MLTCVGVAGVNDLNIIIFLFLLFRFKMVEDVPGVNNDLYIIIFCVIKI